MFLIAILTGILTIGGYFLVMNSTITLTMATVIQLGLLLLTIMAIVLYRGPKKRRTYEGGWYKVWTFRYAILMFSLLGNLAVFVVYVLNLFGFMSEL